MDWIIDADKEIVTVYELRLYSDNDVPVGIYEEFSIKISDLQ